MKEAYHAKVTNLLGMWVETGKMLYSVCFIVALYLKKKKQEFYQEL